MSEGRDIDDGVLEALRYGWGQAYEFGVGPGGFWARRHDQLGLGNRSGHDENPTDGTTPRMR